jgi:hypothetical protein
MTTIGLTFDYTDPTTNQLSAAAFAKIVTMATDFLNDDASGQTVLTVGIYNSKADWNNGLQPIVTQQYPMPAGAIDYTQTIGTGVNALYGYLETLLLFGGATPVTV